MFSDGHLIWIAVSFFLTVSSLILLIKIKPSLSALLKVALGIAVFSEIIKYFSAIQILPLVDSVVTQVNGKPELAYKSLGLYTPVIAPEHLPFELCSIQIFFIAFCNFSKNEGLRHWLYAIMFPTGTIGALIAIPMATIAGEFNTIADYFTNVRVYQFFIYHALLASFSIYLALNKECALSFSDLKKALSGILLLDIPSFYMNSLLMPIAYQQNQPVGVYHWVNFFSSYLNPLGLVLTEKWQWMLYLLVRAMIAIGLVSLLYLCFFRRRKPALQKEA